MATFTPKPGFSFSGAPPKEVLDYLAARKLKSSFDYRDVWKEEHVAAFTVAKAMSLDVLTTFKGAIDQAEQEGIPFRQFAKELKPRLQKLGWWGVTDMKDPRTGETLPVQLGSPRRLRVIYRTNLAVAHSAGRWQRLQRAKAARPYLRYSLGPSIHHREQHVAFAGTVLPIDHPFWATHYPPNGWGCKCYVRSLTREDVRRGGGPSKPPKIRKRRWRNRRTGQTVWVPEGIDPGWDYNAGAARMAHLGQALQEKEQVFAKAFRRPVPPRQLLWPQQGDPVLSTVKGMNRGELERVLGRIPEAEPQIAALARFLHARGTKVLVLKQSEIGGGRAGQAIAERVGRFLGSHWVDHPLPAYSIRGAARTQGFTAPVYNHIVIKARATDRLANVDPALVAQAVEHCIERKQVGHAVWSTSMAHEELTKGLQPSAVPAFVHEVGHQVHYHAGAPRKPAELPSLTIYSTVNDREWHAEHFAAWVLNRKALKRWSPDVVEYFDGLIDRALAH